jgi:hypothetical protein
MLNKQNSSDKLFVLLFLYNKNIKIKRPTTASDVAVYGITCISVSISIFIVDIRIYYVYFTRLRPPAARHP